MIETVLSMKLNIRNLKNIPGRLFNRKVKQSCECAVPEYDEIYIVEQPGGPFRMQGLLMWSVQTFPIAMT